MIDFCAPLVGCEVLQVLFVKSFNKNTMFPTKKGQKFRYESKDYIVQAFYGESGIEYDTYLEAYENNTNKNIGIISTSDGRFRWKDCTLLGEY